MHIVGDFHTHTKYSHGKGTVEENVRAAVECGLQAVAITDHGPGHFFIGIGGMDAFRRLQKEIETLRRKYRDIEILFGVEANIVDIDGTIDVPAAILRELDILLVGYHKLVRPRSFGAFVLGAKNFAAGWLGRSTEKLRAANTAAITAAVRRYPIDAITHPGLQIDIDTAQLARVCHQQQTLLEINSSYGEELDPYIQAALPSGVRFIINSDAHQPGRVGDFSKAFRLVERLHVPADRIVNLAENIPLQKKRSFGV
ncbi:MAG: PHP domain-containing protein [Bacillota bacterium]|nr:PHP domain-containing protein [Bacillota bacterium]MDW7682921.1 PHP domain-containing protein [Bacillota bacterium]